MDKTDLLPYLIIWAIAMSVVVLHTWRTVGAGLMLAYCFQMFLLYWVGAAAHVLPWSELENTDLVVLGFQQCTYAAIAFGVGAIAVGPLIVKRVARRQRIEPNPDPKLPKAYIIYGICSYFILAPTLGQLRGFSAISAVGSQLVVVGCCLNCWAAWSTGGKTALMRKLAPTLAIPCVTILVQGFLGFGVMALSTIMVFCSQFFRPRWILVAGFLISCYIGLSVFATYMRGRDELRSTMWDTTAESSDKIDRFVSTAQAFEFFDPWNQEHLDFVDGRLNQDSLVGAAVEYLSTTDAYANGYTLWEAVIAMVPRAIWPDKPIEAGSGYLASEFTGIYFSEGTSVGVGPVMELYGNFATAGVVFGFIVLGAIIKVLDTMAGVSLQLGNWQSFATYSLVGISFLNVGGSFVEVSMGAMASLVLAKFVNSLLRRAQKVMERRKAAAAAIAGLARA